MGIEDELSGIHRELSMFPERAFDFKNAGTIVIEQVQAAVQCKIVNMHCCGCRRSMNSTTDTCSSGTRCCCAWE